MINVKPAIILALSIPFIQFAHPEVFDGLILYGPMNSRNTYLIDTSGQRVNTWSSNYTCAYMCYLLPIAPSGVVMSILAHQCAVRLMVG